MINGMLLQLLRKSSSLRTVVLSVRKKCPAIFTMSDVDRPMARTIAKGLLAGDVRLEANDTHDESADEEQREERPAGS